MKAKEYYKKYGEDLCDSEKQDEAIKNLVNDFMGEANELLKKRNVKLDRGLLAVIKELNIKWNVLARMCPVLKVDGFKLYVERFYLNGGADNGNSL